MSALPARMLVLAAIAMSSGPARASPFTDAVETAVFNLCPGLRSGRISPARPTALTRAGFRRTPEVEGDWGDVEDGQPFVFARGTGAEAVTIGYWPVPQLCSVSFTGENAAAAAEQVRSRLARETRRFRRHPAGDRSGDFGRHETWRMVRGRHACLSIDAPGEAGDPLSYNISYEPLIPLRPGIYLAACGPH